MALLKIIRSLNRKIESSFLFTVMLLAGITAPVYVLFILKAPDFMADDYYIFYLIRSLPSSIISFNSHEKYLLFLRPVPYFYFWLQYHIFGAHALSMKSIALCLGVLYGVMAMAVMKQVVHLMHISISNVVLLLAGLFVALHPDTILSILWISNVNELLMCVFYALALLVFLGYCRNRINSTPAVYLLLTTLYALSVLSKQQSMHLPLLFIFILILVRDQLSEQRYKTLLWATVPCIMVLVVVLVPNIYLFFQMDNSASITAVLAKKPLSLMGNVVLVFLPFGGSEIFDYFIQHKIQAIAIASLAVALLGFAVSSRYIGIKRVLTALIFVAIVFFPRIIGPGGDRLNTIQVFLLITLLLVLLHGVPRLLMIVLLFVIINSVVGSCKKVETLGEVTEYHNVLSRSLEKIIAQDNRIQFLAYDYSRSPNGYSYYFYKHRDFGRDTLLSPSGLVAWDSKNWFNVPKDVQCKITKDTLTLSTNSPTTFLYWDEDFRPTIIDKDIGTVRAYSRIRTLVPQRLLESAVSYIAPIDSMWVVLR